MTHFSFLWRLDWTGAGASLAKVVQVLEIVVAIVLKHEEMIKERIVIRRRSYLMRRRYWNGWIVKIV